MHPCLIFAVVTTSKNLGLQGDEAIVHWRNERRAKKPATSWRASDAARAAGADGMAYPSRKAPQHWHLVLFRWNTENAPTLCRDGPALAFIPDQ